LFPPDEPEAEVEEERKSFFSLASVKSQLAGFIPTTTEDVWNQVQLLRFL
jgi:hypothetical protein